MDRFIGKAMIVVTALMVLCSVLRAEGIRTVEINNGHLIMYGKYIPPPYKITLKPGTIDGVPHDTIYVNDMPYSPYIRDFDSSRLKRPSKEDWKAYREAKKSNAQESNKTKEEKRKDRDEKEKKGRSIFRDVDGLVREHGLDESQPKIAELLVNYPGIEKCKIEITDEERPGFLRWFDIRGEKIGYLHAVEGAGDPSRISREEKAKRLRQFRVGEFEGLTIWLKNGWLVFRSYAPYPIYMSPDCAEEWLSSVKSILEKESAGSERVFLQHGLDIDPYTVEAIIQDRHGWRKSRFNGGD